MTTKNISAEDHLTIDTWAIAKLCDVLGTIKSLEGKASLKKKHLINIKGVLETITTFQAGDHGLTNAFGFSEETILDAYHLSACSGNSLDVSQLMNSIRHWDAEQKYICVEIIEMLSRFGFR